MFIFKVREVKYICELIIKMFSPEITACDIVTPSVLLKTQQQQQQHWVDRQQHQGQLQTYPRSDNINQSNSGHHDPLITSRNLVSNIARLSRQWSCEKEACPKEEAELAEWGGGQSAQPQTHIASEKSVQTKNYQLWWKWGPVPKAVGQKKSDASYLAR